MKIRRLIDTGEWTTRRYLSLLGNILIWIIVAIDAWYLWPTQLGGDTSIVVVSGSSMEPAYFGGDLVIARKMAPSIGDVIVYAPEGLGGSQVVHRIIGGSADEGWRMQGDNNTFVDPFTPQGDEVKGVVLVHYANFGRVTVLLLNPMVWAFVLLAAMVMMLWWTGDDCDDDDDDDDSDDANSDREQERKNEEEPDLIDRVVEGTEAALARMVAAVSVAATATLDAFMPRSASPRHAGASTSRGALVQLRTVAIFTAVGFASIVGTSFASASQLAVTASSETKLVTVDKCADLALSARPAGSSTKGQKWYNNVTISGIASGCENLPMTVSVYASNGDPTQPATGTSTLGSQDFQVQEYHANQVQLVVVKIDGWLYLATWTA